MTITKRAALIVLFGFTVTFQGWSILALHTYSIISFWVPAFEGVIDTISLCISFYKYIHLFINPPSKLVFLIACGITHGTTDVYLLLQRTWFAWTCCKASLQRKHFIASKLCSTLPSKSLCETGILLSSPVCRSGMEAEKKERRLAQNRMGSAFPRGRSINCSHVFGVLEH